MIRRGDWKLVYYHDAPPQLFNLAEDPGELADRAEDPACSDIREELTRRVLDGWDPAWIAAEMAAKDADNAVLAAWARQIRPPDRFRWNLRPEMNYLVERDL
ncbi:MAG: sulfatase-like hydrolase/transferase, partial [Anaerolineae bacterium]